MKIGRYEASSLAPLAAPRGGSAALGAARRTAMTELRNTEREISRFHLRLAAAALFVLFAFGLLIARLSFLQISKHEELSTQAENNRIAVVPITPNRGLILDRNGVVLANNYSAYTLEIAPGKVANLDATIDELSKIVEIQPRDRKRFKRLLDESRSVESLAIRTKLSDGKWRASRRSASASKASRSRRGFSAAIRWVRSAAT